MVEGQTSLSLRRLKETTNTTFKDSFNKIASFIVQKKKKQRNKKVISYAKIEREIIILCLATANNHNPKIRKKPPTAIQLPY
jgi:hypothetical protein